MHYFTPAEIATLERLRGRFLAPDTRAGDYWRSEEELALYDSTFGERIGWKWDAVLSELSVRGWQPQGRRLVDWGCGSGIASRRVLRRGRRAGATRRALRRPAGRWGGPRAAARW